MLRRLILKRVKIVQFMQIYFLLHKWGNSSDFAFALKFFGKLHDVANIPALSETLGSQVCIFLVMLFLKGIRKCTMIT